MMFSENFNKIRSKLTISRYSEHRGKLIRKYKNFIGQYIFVLKNEKECVSVCVGKGLFDFYEIGEMLIVGKIGRKVINIRPIKD